MSAEQRSAIKMHYVTDAPEVPDPDSAPEGEYEEFDREPAIPRHR